MKLTSQQENLEVHFEFLVFLLSVAAIVAEAIHLQNLRGQRVPVLTVERADDHTDSLKVSQSPNVPVVVVVVSGGCGRGPVDVVQTGQHDLQCHAELCDQRLEFSAAEETRRCADVHDYPLLLQGIVRITLSQERQHVGLGVILNRVSASVATSGVGQCKDRVDPRPLGHTSVPKGLEDFFASSLTQILKVQNAEDVNMVRHFVCVWASIAASSGQWPVG